MVAVTRAQAKRAAAAASTSTSASPAKSPAQNPTSIGRDSNRKRVAISRAKRTRASVPSQSPAGQSKLRASKRKTARRPATPTLSDDESLMESIDHEHEHQKSPAECVIDATQTDPSSLKSFANSDDTAAGWVRFGNGLRRELTLPPGVISQIQAQQQANLSLRADEAYKEQTEAMMQQRNLTYQWYDRMMTEGLQSNQESDAAMMVISDAGSDTVMDDDHALKTDWGEDTDMEMGYPGDSSMAKGLQRSNEILSASQSSIVACSKTDESIPRSKRQQLQPCPPGVQYSLFDTPTEIIEQP